MHRGYIKVYRKIVDSWIFDNSDYFKAFYVIVAEVNHKDKSVLVKSKLINCKRGESVNCLDTWAKKFGKKWDKSRVRRFFKLLEKDSMIVLKNETVTTHLSVCNYETYQGEQNANETKMKHKCNTDETQVTLNKNDKNDKNVNKYKGVKDFSSFPGLNVESWVKWIEYKKQIKSRYKTLNGEVKQINELIKISNGDAAIQEQIVQQSIDKEWKGLFPIKENTGGNQQWSLF